MLNTMLDLTVGVRAQLKVCEESGSADRQEIYLSTDLSIFINPLP